MNRERLKTLRDHLAGLPDERLDMRYVITDGATNLMCRVATGEALNICGTAACIAGWTGFLFNPTKIDYGSDVAARDLELTWPQSSLLFTPDHFDERGRYSRSEAIAAIDSMLANPDDLALPVWPEKEKANA